MGRSRVNKRGLTQKQEAFKNEAVAMIKSGKQLNGTEIASKIYNAKSRKVAGAIAGENMKKPVIKESIEQALSSVGLTPSVALTEIKEIATKKGVEITGDTKLRANIEILKLLGAYPNRQKEGFVINVNQEINNLSFDQARERLASLDGSNREVVIDADIQPIT